MVALREKHSRANMFQFRRIGLVEKELKQFILEYLFRVKCYPVWLRVAFATLVTGHLFAQNVSFFLRNQVDAGPTPVALAIGDFNNDGIPDVAVADAQGSIDVLLGVGKGFFRAPLTFTLSSSPVAIVSGDFNNDGRLDLAVASPDANSVSVLLGNGDGTFTLVATLLASNPVSLAVADFNGDGRLDLAVANPTANSVSILLGIGNGNFLQPLNFSAGVWPVWVAVGDFNRDGKLDLAVANFYSGTVSVLLGFGNGTFQTPLSFSTGQFPVSIAVADFNHDGRPDLAVANATSGSSTVSVLIGNGNGTFQDPRSFAAGINPTYVLAADLNNDGNADLAVVNRTSNAISVLLGLGNGIFLPPQSFEAGIGPTWIGVVDFTGNGSLDLVVSDSLSNLLSILINTSGTAAPAVNPNGIVNATSYVGGGVAPGEMVTIFGSHLGPVNPVGLQLTSDGLAANTLAQTQVFFDGLAARLVFVLDNQVTAIVPFEVAGRAHTEVQVQNNGLVSTAVALPVVASAPGLFTADSSGTGQGAILNQDQSVNSASNPAATGSIISLFATGAGQTDPPGVDGMFADSVLSKPLLPVTVTIGNQDAHVLYAAGASGLVAGVIQVNVRLPSITPSGAVPVILRVGTATSRDGVTVSVR